MHVIIFGIMIYLKATFIQNKFNHDKFGREIPRLSMEKK